MADGIDPRAGLRWRALAMVCGTALLTVLSLDLGLQHCLTYPEAPREVEDAIHDYRVGDPTILVLGSSHARTFDSVAAEVARRDPEGERLLSLPLEYGKFASYQWLMQHRVWPLVDERRADGTRKRPSLRQVILVTEWWDSCDTEDGQPSLNLPARAWTLTDFLRAVRTQGMTAYNRNYVTNRWQRHWGAFILVRDRTQQRLMGLLRDRMLGPSPERKRAYVQAKTAVWQGMVEKGVSCIASPVQMLALDSMLAEFGHRGISITILLYPRKPGTLTEQARNSTLPRFADIMARRARLFGARFVDLTTTSPLTDDDFADDFDHVTAHGNSVFTRWALSDPLNWLVEPSPAFLGGPAPAGASL